ncbi:phosphopantetheine-binding protein [Paenibacillus curdlanolyticus YK9]|uniref:Phosphopantetheine-binding protein n=1 Tax=Paenibacillus curdlanolyticus YK9 TaxID=717606 RepID=E0I5B9_9BACL|nr:acyl carrier protein [Paenibacillus curdlanolyticus]EFM12161.1 phosphopantetheine-binding protein [Paenibacillus curdlanolyticus YK9]
MQQTTAHELEAKVKSILADILKCQAATIEADANLTTDLGMDSIQFLDMLANLEEQFGFELDVDDMHPDRFQSAQAIIRFIQGRATA